MELKKCRKVVILLLLYYIISIVRYISTSEYFFSFLPKTMLLCYFFAETLYRLDLHTVT